MRRRLIAICTLVMIFSVCNQHALLAQNSSDGALSSDLIAKLRNSYKRDGKDQALYNALATNDLKSLDVDHDKVVAHNTLFSKEIKAGDITNQEGTGRCWMFAGFNLIRPAIMKKLSLGSVKLSTNYMFFWDKLEKVNTFLEQIIETANKPTDDREMEVLLKDPYTDGGWWSSIADLMNKYGVVPEQTMPETYASSNSGSFNYVMVVLLRQDASLLREMHKAGKSDKMLRDEKTRMLGEAYRIIALNFGVPPEKFVWRYEGKDSAVVAPKEYTPKQFYQELVGFDLSEFVPIFNYPGKEYFKLYRLDQSRNMYDKQDFTFINLPIDSLKRYSLASILSDEPVYFACDVSKDNYGKKGILESGIYDFNSVYGTNLAMTKQQQIDYYQSTPNHAMLFTGVDTTNGKATKWKVENSWGTSGGDSGWWTMYDNWYSDYVYVAIINKKYLPKEVTGILETKPTILPVWDPMYESMRRVNSSRREEQ